MARRRQHTTSTTRSAVIGHTPTHSEEVDLAVVSNVTDDEASGWRFMRLEDGTVAIQPGVDVPIHAIAPSAWVDLVGALSADGATSAVVAGLTTLHLGTETDPEDQPEPDLRKALAWAMHLLTRPQDQHDFCSQHGKVPITHVCVYHSNADFAHASHALEGVTV